MIFGSATFIESRRSVPPNKDPPKAVSLLLRWGVADRSFVSLEFPPSPMGVFARRIKHPLHVPVSRAKQAQSCEQHRTAIFSGIDQHVNGKPPFLTIVL
jgi:hypothetical protein